MNRKKDQSGFTLFELLLAMAIATVLSTVLLMITFSYFANTLKAQATALMAIESQQVLHALVDDTRIADGFSTTNSITDTNAPGGIWTTSSSGGVLVLKSPAIDSDRNIIYDEDTGYPHTNELVYFKSSDSVFKRTLKNTSASGNVAITTCPTATPTCPADRLLSANVSSLSFTFADADGVTTSDPSLARSINLAITLAKKVFGQTISVSNSIQVTLRNQ